MTKKSILSIAAFILVGTLALADNLPITVANGSGDSPGARIIDITNTGSTTDLSKDTLTIKMHENTVPFAGAVYISEDNQGYFSQADYTATYQDGVETIAFNKADSLASGSTLHVAMTLQSAESKTTPYTTDEVAIATGSGPTPVTPTLTLSNTDVSATEADFSEVLDHATSATDFKLYRDGSLVGSFSASDKIADTKVEAGKTYAYYLVAEGVKGNTDVKSNTVNVSIPTPEPTQDSISGSAVATLKSKKDIEATVNFKTLDADGNPVSVDHYTVNKHSDFAKKVIAVTPAVSPLVDNGKYNLGLYWDTTYYYDVTAFDKNNTALAEKTITVSTSISAPTVTLTATAKDSSEADLAWTLSKGSATGYSVYRNDGSGTPFNKVSDALSGDATQFNDTSVSKDDGKTVEYYVEAQTATGVIDSSKQAVAIPDAATPTLALTINPTSDSEIDLTWALDKETADTFSVYRELPKGKYELLTSSATQDKGYQDTDVSKYQGKTLSYYVESNNLDKTHTDSDKQSVVVPQPGPTPSGKGVKGFPNYISFGGITNGTTRGYNVTPDAYDETTPYDNGKVHVDSIFFYDNDHDAYNEAKAISNTAATLSTDYGMHVVPQLVVYTCNLSAVHPENGHYLPLDDISNVEQEFQGLINDSKQLEDGTDAAKDGNKGSILLNPDFLCQVWKDGFVDDYLKSGSVSVNEALKAVVSQSGKNINVPKFEDNIKGWIQAQNWIIKTYGPDVTFSWELNLWNGATDTLNWVHGATASDVQNVANDYVDYLNKLGVYNGTYKPDYIAFDKYGVDSFTSNGDYLKSGYLFNQADLDNFVNFVGDVSKAYNNLPVMLWQLPGGHLLTKNEKGLPTNIGSTEATYIFGDSTVKSDFSNLNSSLLTELGMDVTAVYKAATGVNTYKDYISGDWSKGHMDLLKSNNVFSVEFGATTTSESVGDSYDVKGAPRSSSWIYDESKANVWLPETINNYYKNPTVIN